MYREFQEFIASRQSPELLEHRRTDKSKSALTMRNRGGSVSLAPKVKDDDFEYGARRL